MKLETLEIVRANPTFQMQTVRCKAKSEEEAKETGKTTDGK